MLQLYHGTSREGESPEALGDLGLGRLPERPELRLYRLLCQQHATEAYGQYNALLRQLSSFCRALEMQSHQASQTRIL